eukprot:UN02914
MVQVQQNSGTNVVDYNRYASVPETQKIDYSKLTQISDKDVMRVVSIQETVIKDDGDGSNITKQTTSYKPDGDTTETSKLSVQQTNTQNNAKFYIDSDQEAEKIDTLEIIIENNNDDTNDTNDRITLQGIGGDTTISFLKNKIAKLKNCRFYDEDGYEIINLNTKIEAVTDIDGDKFILNAKIVSNNDSTSTNTNNENKVNESNKIEHGYTNTVVVKNDVAMNSSAEESEGLIQSELQNNND